MTHNRLEDNSKKTFEEIEQEQRQLDFQKSLQLQNMLESNDPNDLMKAYDIIEGKNKMQEDKSKSFVFAPQSEYYNGSGYKAPTSGMSFSVLRGMSNTFINRAIINTRIDQVKRFSEFTTDLQKEGWTITKRLNRFERTEGKYELTDKDKKVIDQISTMLENSGDNQKWDNVDDFPEFLDQLVNDSLSFDQATFECMRSRNKKLYGWKAIDGATIRFLETIDKNSPDTQTYAKDNGHNPLYGQVWNGQVAINKQTNEKIVYYPWELGYIVRNKTTNIHNNGYGVSEAEILMEIVTYILWGMQYNGNFFKQGSTPKGFFTIKGNVPQKTIDGFRQAWKSMLAGVQNSHKTPIFDGSSEINWVDMQGSNKDMEFSQFQDFLISIACSVYKIDPSELGFNLQQSSNMFGQDGQHERLQHSKEKGLKPILQVVQKAIDKYLVSEIDSNYEFKFTGIDLENEKEKADLRTTLLSSGQMSMEDAFEAVNNRKFNPNKDTILNQVYWQAQQAKQFGGEESNAAVDQMTGESEEGSPNPFEEYEKGPIMNKALDYIKETMT